PVFLNWVSSLVRGSTRDRVSRSMLGAFAIPFPPLNEQCAICEWIAEQCQPLDEAIASSENEIKLIREYRDRLIADAVNGQVDVRSWKPGAEDLVRDEELSALGDEEADTAEEEDAYGDD